MYYIAIGFSLNHSENNVDRNAPSLFPCPATRVPQKGGAMSAVSEWIVREYFETQGFLVREPCKYQVAARKKRAEEEVDLLVLNPKASEHRISSTMIWSSRQLRHIEKAMVSIRGWHTDRFSPAVLESSPEIFRFTEDEVVSKTSKMLGEGPIAKILCVPDMPSSKTLAKESLDMLREKGVDGVLLFRNMLLELAGKIETKNSYEQSDLLQILRILKNYGLLKDAQMELFGRKRRKKSG